MEYPFKIQQKNVTHPISATVSTNNVSFVPLLRCNPWSALWCHNFIATHAAHFRSSGTI